jgi:dienelactone hydrolase
MLPWGKSRLAAAVLVLGAVLPVTASAQPPDDLTFTGAGGIPLHGTVFRPAGPPKSAIVLQGGSDWQERADLRVQAETFTRLGVTTLVYDRRTIGYSKTRRDYGVLADDLVAAVGALRAQPGVDPADVGVWGVSEGGWVAPLAATRSPGIAYVITVGASGLGGARQTSWYWGNVLRHQGIDGSLLQTLPVRGTRFAVGAGLFPEAGHDPVPVLKQLKQPLLALWGDLDISHAPLESARIFAGALAGHPDHTLRFVPGGGPDLYATTDAGFDRLPSVVPGYPAAVAAWLADRRGVHVETPAFTQRPTEALAPLAWWESAWAQGIALLVLLAGFVVALFPRARWLGGLGLLTVAGFTGLLGWAQTSGMKDFGPVVLGRPVPWLLLQALAVATVVAFGCTAAKLRKPAGRRGLLLPVTAGAVFLPWALYWGLLLP